MNRFDKLLGKRSVSEAQAVQSFTRRSMVLGGAQLLLGGVLAGRMAWLSIAEREHYRLLSESNRVSLSLIPPRRGWIVDRHGRPLALNKTVFRVDVVKDRMQDREATVETLAKLLGLDAEEHQRILDDLDAATGFQPVQVAENLDWEKYAALSVRAQELPGVIPSQGFARYYPDGAAVGQLLGYVGTASAADYATARDPLMITPGYKVGKAGVEKIMQDVLKGTPGARRSEVTARGKLVRDLANRPDIPGQTLHMTIDAGVQAYAARRFGNNSGACVVIDTLTGGILALASMPAYDPNNFTDGISAPEWKRLSHDDHLPLVNKALQGLYPPGSTSKPMSGLAFLQAGVDPNATVNCRGALRVGNTLFHCDKRTGHGPISLDRAIVKSCDIYFYTMGMRAGIAPVASMFRTMGLGQTHPLPVTAQHYGTVPDPEWLLRKYKRQWAIYDTVNTSIGQGYVLVSPLQLAVMAARMATGRKIVPSLIGRGAPAPLLGLNPEHLAFVQNAMGGVVNRGGTAAADRLPIDGVQMAGKTGTAQVRHISMAERGGGVRSNASLQWRLRDHALFIAFAPIVDARYAMAVLVEHGGFGATTAAPIARDVMTYLFDPAKAMATLETLEKGWGGDIATRMRHQTDLDANPVLTPEPGAANASDTVA